MVCLCVLVHFSADDIDRVLARNEHLQLYAFYLFIVLVELTQDFYLEFINVQCVLIHIANTPALPIEGNQRRDRLVKYLPHLVSLIDLECLATNGKIVVAIILVPAIVDQKPNVVAADSFSVVRQGAQLQPAALLSQKLGSLDGTPPRALVRVPAQDRVQQAQLQLGGGLGGALGQTQQKCIVVIVVDVQFAELVCRK